MLRRRSNSAYDLDKIAVEILEEAVGEPAPMTPAGRKNPAAAQSRRTRTRARTVAGTGPKSKRKSGIEARGLSVKKRKP